MTVPGSPPVEPTFRARAERGWLVVEARGELDLGSADALREVLSPDDGSSRVVVDLTEVTFLDSTILSVLVTAMRRLEEGGGAFALVGVDGSPRKVLSLTGLDESFRIETTLDDLLGSASGG